MTAPRKQGGWRVRLRWEPRDFVVGFRWTEPTEFIGSPPLMRSQQWFLWLVPCVPIVITKWKRLR